MKRAETAWSSPKGCDKGALTTWQAKSGAARCAKVRQLPFWIWMAATESRTEKAGAFRAAIAARGIVRNSAAFAQGFAIVAEAMLRKRGSGFARCE